MKTPIQELIDRLKEERDLHGYERGLHYETAIEFAESMLEKEKEVMVDFAYKFGDEPLSEIPKWHDRQFKTK